MVRHVSKEICGLQSMPGSFQTTQPLRNVQLNVKELCTVACEGIGDWGGELLWIYVPCPVLSLDCRENNFNILPPFLILNGDQYLAICYCASLPLPVWM